MAREHRQGSDRRRPAGRDRHPAETAVMARALGARRRLTVAAADRVPVLRRVEAKSLIKGRVASCRVQSWPPPSCWRGRAPQARLPTVRLPTPKMTRAQSSQFSTATGHCDIRRMARYSSLPEMYRAKEATSMLGPKNKRIHVRASAHEAPSSQGHAEAPADVIKVTDPPLARHLQPVVSFPASPHERCPVISVHWRRYHARTGACQPSSLSLSAGDRRGRSPGDQL